MRRTLTLCRTGLAGVAAFVLLTACGGGSTDAASSSSSSSASAPTTSSSSAENSAPAADTEFCTRASALIQQVQGADINPEDFSTIGPFFRQAATSMRAIDAPPEIASDWTALADGLQQLGDVAAGTDFKDPQQAAAFGQKAAALEAQFQASSTKVDTYLQTQCGITTGDTAAPTS